jgi:hypothetical protein
VAYVAGFLLSPKTGDRAGPLWVKSRHRVTSAIDSINLADETERAGQSCRWAVALWLTSVVVVQEQWLLGEKRLAERRMS